ncbi:MAG TPA: hypothetical protein VGO56_14470 [Pyrinomonadaceae bacterium]|nr:hypothetical protein [Pyrinomonadaceae bacterium]
MDSLKFDWTAGRTGGRAAGNRTTSEEKESETNDEVEHASRLLSYRDL